MERKLIAWREKAKSRRIKIWALEKRIKEVKEGREKWKLKYFQLKEEIGSQQIEANECPFSKAKKVRHHIYNAEEVSFFLNMRTVGGISLRACVRIISVLQFVLGLNFRTPSISTIRAWEIKLGYHTVHQFCDAPQTDWVLILDESVQIGSQKMLLLLGVNLNRYHFEAALCSEDVQVLELRIGKSWKSEQIKSIIDQVKKRGYRFLYGCSDNGGNLRKSLEMSEIVQIEDCGHSLGKLLEKQYKTDAVYQKFCEQKNRFMRQNVLSKHAVFLPPKQRTKGRFLNLDATCKWAMKLLRLFRTWQAQKEKPEGFEAIKWILTFEQLIEKIYQEQQLINQVNKILKVEGLSQQSKEKCLQLMQKSEIDTTLIISIKEYLNRNLDKLPMEKQIICSSDIIESTFGRLKNKFAESSTSGLSEGSLAVANYGKKISEEQTKKAMEEIKIIDIKQWRKNNLPISLNQKRRAVFKNTG